MPAGSRLIGPSAPGTVTAVFGRRKEREKSLFETGRPAVGTVTGVRDTGATVDEDALRVVITFRIDPLDDTLPYEGHRPATLARHAIPRAGERYPILFDAENPAVFAYVTSDGSDNARQRIVHMWGDAFGEDGSEVGPHSLEAEEDAALASAAADPLDRLAKLDALRRSGALTDEEFAEQKRKILGE